jgi:isopenicillin-N N-acyltransferase-like protein
MFPIISVSGAPYERGFQYGAATAALIRHSIASYARLFAYRRGLDWAASGEVALAYRPLLADLAPHLLEEMRGIAAGADLRFEEILTLNVRTELMAGIGSGARHPDAGVALAHNRAAGVPQHANEASLPLPETSAEPPFIDDGECTTVAALPEATGGQTLLAQTWDWSGDQRAACIMLRLSAPGKPTLLTMTEAGMLAKIGVNDAGVAVSLNLLRSLADGQHVGMPVHVLLRLMLEAQGYDAARELVTLAPAAGSSCVTVASAEGDLVSFELTPNGVGAIYPENGVLAHTNHCIDELTHAGESPPDPLSTSVDRYDRARILLAAQRGNISVGHLQQILRDREGAPRCISRRPDMRLHPVDRGESVCGIVIEVERGVMHVAPGVPSDVEFEPVQLTGDR